MGGGLVFAGLGGLFAFYGMRFIRDKSSNYRFTKGLTLLGLTVVCWGTFPQAQRFSSGTQIFAQMIVGMLFFGVGGAVVGFVIDWYRRQDNGLEGEANPGSLQGRELDCKVETSSGSSLKLNPIHKSKPALSAADLVRLEQLTSLRDRGTLSQSQFEIERDIILGVSEPINQSSDAVRDVSPPLPPPPLPPPSASPPTPPERSSTAGTTVQKGSGSNAGFIAVMLLPFILIGLVVYGGGTGSSPAEVVAETTQDTLLDQALDNEKANKCYEAIAAENWQAIWYSCSAQADQGDTLAQTALGFMYDNGKGVAEDKAEALRWYRKAADQGDANAQVNLGIMYDNGEGVAEDKAEALRWYRKAAEQGNADAQNNLGVMYYNGEGVAEDKAEALRWYRKAADQGDANAQVNLGIMYDNGEGVAEDKAEALRWYRKAADQGNSYAQKRLDELGY